MSEQNIETLRNQFKEMDEQLVLAKKQLKALKKFSSQLKDIEQTISTLNAFYHSENWLEDRELLNKYIKNEHFLSASEDAIWNTHQEYYNEKIKLLKQLTKTL